MIKNTIESMIQDEITQFEFAQNTNITMTEDNGFRSQSSLDEKCHQLAMYGEHLLHWNRKMNLVGEMTEATFVTKHIMDSLAILPYLNNSRVLDFGTGAGLPGVPLAIMRPDIAFDLLDARSRRIEFIRYVKGALKLNNIELFVSRVEDYKPNVNKGGAVGQIVTRAVASLSLIIDLTKHCLSSDGQWLVMKGVYPEKELQEIADAGRQYKVELLTIKNMIEKRHLVIVDNYSIT